MNIPEHWQSAELQELGEWKTGSTPRRSNEEYWGGDILWVSPKDMKTDRIEDTEDHMTEKALEETNSKIIPTGSLIMVTRSGILEHSFPVALNEKPVTINQDLKALTPSCRVNSAYLYYCLRSKEMDILKSCSKDGTTVASINSDALYAYEVPIAPLSEQERIVAKIEELFTQLDFGVENLTITDRRLDIYRLAITKSALKGELTENWRRENSPSLSASDLMERAEEKEEQNKYKKQNKLSDASEEYTFEVPNSWGWAKVGDLCKEIRYGSSEKADYQYDGVPMLRMGNINDGKLDFDDLKYLPAEWEREELMLQTGDVLFNRTNSAELVGKTALYKENHPLCTFASYLVRARVYPDIYNPALLTYYTNSIFGQQYINSVISQQVGQANVNATKFASMPIPVPPLGEQNEIVRQIDHRFSIVDEVKSEVNSNLKRSNRLRQSILKKAFEGKLIPHDPTDEPVEESVESGDTNHELGEQKTLSEVTSDVE